MVSEALKYVGEHDYLMQHANKICEWLDRNSQAGLYALL